MNIKKITKESALFAGIEALLCIVMAVILALVYKYDLSLILGTVAGWVIALIYYLSIVVFVDMAATKAENNDIEGGQKLLQMARSLRMVGVFLLLVLLAITKVFDVLAMALPLLFVRPAITILDAVQRKGVKS